MLASPAADLRFGRPPSADRPDYMDYTGNCCKKNWRIDQLMARRETTIMS
jgi:hypothetical protein